MLALERPRSALAEAFRSLRTGLSFSINTPRLLLCDEPTGNLDRRTGAEILDLLSALNAGGQTIIVVTHNMGVAELCGRTVIVEDGCVASAQTNGNANPMTEQT
jgi:ABC-type lipoprotein export system ATPase subunit